MPGAWEIRQHTSVLAYTLSVDTTTVAWAYGIRNLQFPGHFLPITGMPYDHARNEACKRCLEGGYEWLLSIDSDTIPPHDGVLRLLAHNQPIISGLYCRRSPPHGIPVMIKNGQWVTQFRDGAVIEVDLVGAGFLLIHRSVLERLPPQRPGYHWFDWRVNFQGLKDEKGNPYFGGANMSEDFTFMIHARNHGYKVLVDTGVKCRHVGYSEYTYNSCVPLNTTPMT